MIIRIREVNNLDEISEGFGGTPGGSEDVIDSSELQDLLGDPSGDDSGPTRGGDHADGDGATLSGNLAGNGVGLSDLVTPIASPHRNNRELCENDGAAYGGGDFLAALHSETDVAVVVADHHEGLEAGSLTGAGLLLDGHDLHHLVLQGGAHQRVNDLVLLDWERV